VLDTFRLLLREIRKRFTWWWLASAAGPFIFFTGLVQWLLGRVLAPPVPEFIRVTLGGGLLIVGVVGVVVSAFRVFHEVRVERDALRAAAEAIPRAELGFVFDENDPVCLPPIPPERFREQGVIRIGLSNKGNVRAKGVRVAVAWTDPLGDPALNGHRLRSYSHEETEFEIPCDPSGAPTAYAHIGQILQDSRQSSRGTILLDFGRGHETKMAPVVRLGLRMEHDTGVHYGALVLKLRDDERIDIEFAEGDQRCGPTISSIPP
jgi:hypothetical protein